MEDDKAGFRNLERALGLRFQAPNLLKQALVHSSHLNEHPGAAQASNERLEFLGDALLDVVVAAELYERCPQLPEGELTMARSALVRGETLAEMAAELGLGGLLLLGQGERRSGGGGRASNLAGAFEAVIGAAFVDQGYAPAQELVLRLLQSRIEVVVRDGVPQNAKSRLQEVVQRRGQAAPVYRIDEEDGPDYSRQFVSQVLVEGEVLGKGSGQRKAEAERLAAQAALEALDGDGVSESNPGCSKEGA